MWWPHWPSAPKLATCVDFWRGYKRISKSQVWRTVANHNHPLNFIRVMGCYSFKWTIKSTIRENSHLFNWHCGKSPPLKFPKDSEGVARLLSGARPRTSHVSQHQFIVITNLFRVWCMSKQWVVFSSNLFQIRQLTYASKSWTIDLSSQVQLSKPFGASTDLF